MSSSAPSDFSWVVPGVLAASSRPYNARQAMEFFVDEGVGVVVSLTTSPLSEAVVEEFGLEYHHIPVHDFTAPSAAQINRFVSIVQRTRRAGGKVVVHCEAGRGRTGTMIACYLVSLGRSAEEALDEVRGLRPGSIETAEQESAVERYARRLGYRKGPS